MSILHLIVFTMMILPAILVLLVDKTSGYGRFGWALFSFFLSWIGFAIFFIVHAGRSAPAKHG
jgi:hypothetical protein